MKKNYVLLLLTALATSVVLSGCEIYEDIDMGGLGKVHVIPFEETIKNTGLPDVTDEETDEETPSDVTEETDDALTLFQAQSTGSVVRVEDEDCVEALSEKAFIDELTERGLYGYAENMTYYENSVTVSGESVSRNTLDIDEPYSETWTHKSMNAQFTINDSTTVTIMECNGQWAIDVETPSEEDEYSYDDTYYSEDGSLYYCMNDNIYKETPSENITTIEKVNSDVLDEIIANLDAE